MIPLYPHDDLAGRIAHLLRYADPHGEAAPRLARLLKAAQENCILGPGALRFLSDLERRTQNIECTSLLGNGACGIQADLGVYAPCPHKDRFAACPMYESLIPSDDKPLIAIGIEVAP